MGARVMLLVALVALGCAPGDAPASQAQATGPDGGEPSPTRFLRQLSFDLRGEPPSPDEYRAVVRFGVVPDGIVDGMLRDPRFIARVKRWHADLLWPSVAGFELTLGARLVCTPGRGQNLSVDNINPERLAALLDRRTDEPACPPPSSPAHLTAASCCTADRPGHPACCLARNRAYTPDDPACVAKSAALPAAVFSYGVGAGDRTLRGGDTYLGCDADLEYPPPRVASTDARWRHDADGRPWYVSPRSGQRRYYYDGSDVPLPYDDALHCPDYCRRAAGTGPGGAFARADYAAKVRVTNGVTEEGDGPGFACPPGHVTVRNPCDNAVAVRASSRVEIRQEGWRFTRPWWAGGRLIKTCAHDAQERAASVHTGLACRPGEVFEASCGCGERGLACAPYTGDAQNPSLTLARLRDALGEEPLQLLASIVDRDEDYATVFTTRRGVANGPLAFMNRHQADQAGELEFGPSAPRAAVPDLAWDDPAWRAYERGPEHSGVLTTPAYLARFGTARARANQFRTAFLCTSFSPSPTPLPSPQDACNREPDLARRCGCRGCHAVLEPMGAHWGRWAERGTRFLDPAGFPVDDAACGLCVGAACPARCRHYVTAAPDLPAPAFRGRLRSHLYRSAADLQHIAAGPRALVEASVANGDLQRCAARTVWRILHNRAMNDREERLLLPTLLRAFEASGRSYRALVRAVVSSPSYRWID